MSITVTTQSPRTLFDKIKSAIDKGEVDAWSYDEDGDFTLEHPKWKNKAWIRRTTVVSRSSITFGLLGRMNQPVTKEEYAIFHARFAEMLLTHFDTVITAINVSSLPTPDDILAPNKS